MRLFRFIALTLILLLSACAAQPTTIDPPTAAIEPSATLEAELTEPPTAAPTASPTRRPTRTPQPTNTPLPPSLWEERSGIMPTPRSENAAAVIDGLIYIPGGNDVDSLPTDSLEVYDPQTDTWAVRAPMPEPRHHMMTASYNGRLYAFGGVYQQGPLTTAWVYNPATNAWAAIADLPEPRQAGAAVTLDDAIYIVGGTGSSRALLRYNPASNSWDELAPLITTREHNQAVALDGKIYALAGRWFPGIGDLATTEIYDPTTDEWTHGPVMLEPRSGFAASVRDGKIYVAGGEVFGSGFPFAIRTVEVLDPAVGEWVAGSPLPLTLHGVPMVTVDETIYILGGSLVATEAINRGEVYVLHKDS